jgi:PadR family transcriptional regulator, regulatory protein PadR
MSPQREILKGTLDLTAVDRLEAMRSDRYRLARPIEQNSGDAILLNQETIYDSLARLERCGLIRSEWGTLVNKRHAKFYSIMPEGSRRLAEAAQSGEHLS